MPIRIPAKSNRWRPLALCVAMILFNPPMISAGANQTETTDPWIVAAKIMRNEQDSATGVYLKPGLVVTAAHLTVSWTANLSVHIAGTVLPANLVKQGEVEEVETARAHCANSDVVMSSTSLAGRSGHRGGLRRRDPVSHRRAADFAIWVPNQISHFDWRCCQHGKFRVGRVRPKSEMLARNHEPKIHGSWQRRRQIFCPSERNSRIHTNRA